MLAETAVSRQAAAKPLAVIGRTVVRWITDGLAAGGTVIFLEATVVGGRWETSREAVVRFLTECEAARRQPAPVVVPSPAKRRRMAADDRKDLEKMGVLI